MFNLFDILQAQAGANVQGLGRQFGLTQEQSLRAMEALLPALTMGLQRNAIKDPTGFAHLFNLVGPNPGASTAQAPQMDMLVKQLFGSSHLSQAVLQQAAAASGVATPALKQMLPMMAGMVVAGIVHVMLNQDSAPAAQAAPQPFGVPANAWSDMMQAFLSSGTPAKPPAPSPPSRKTSASPRLTVASKSAPQPQPAPNATAGAEAPFEAMQQMFQTGLEVQQENARAMQRLFDTFWQESQAAAPVPPTSPEAPAPAPVEPKAEEPKAGLNRGPGSASPRGA